MSKKSKKLVTGFEPLDTVLGPVAPDALILLRGAPGTGKTTLLMQAMSENDEKKIFFSCEQSDSDLIKMCWRFPNRSFMGTITVATNRNMYNMLHALRYHRYTYAVVDGLSRMADRFSINKRYLLGVLNTLARETRTIIFVTDIMEDMQLSHESDAVLQLDYIWDATGSIVLSVLSVGDDKNRFGRLDQSVTMRITDKGMVLV